MWIHQEEKIAPFKIVILGLGEARAEDLLRRFVAGVHGDPERDVSVIVPGELFHAQFSAGAIRGYRLKFEIFATQSLNQAESRFSPLFAASDMVINFPTNDSKRDSCGAVPTSLSHPALGHSYNFVCEGPNPQPPRKGLQPNTCGDLIRPPPNQPDQVPAFLPCNFREVCY